MPNAENTARILEKIRAVENKLSPENLFWDGERDNASARKAERVLTKELNALVKELGRQPTLTELYA